MPVGEMLHRMSARELSEWQAFFRIEREEREEMRERARMEHGAASGAARRARNPTRRKG